MDETVKELHKKRAKLWDASITGHKKYINPESGRFKDEYLEPRNCPVCDHDTPLALFIKEGGQYVKCLNCGMVYINPVFTDTALADYYKTNHAVQSEMVEDDDSFYEKLYNTGLDTIEKMSIKGDILDIGCSSGKFLDMAKTRDWNTYGVELNTLEFEMAQKKHHRVFNEPLENIEFELKFSVITLWDVFEHMKDGRFYLGLMKSLLKKNGVVFMQIPSSDSLAAKMLQDKCNMFDGLEHVNLYGVKTMEKMAEGCGFSILDMQSVISEIGVINNYLSYEDPYQGSTTNKLFIPGLIDETALNEKLMGYKLQVLLRSL